MACFLVEFRLIIFNYISDVIFGFAEKTCVSRFSPHPSIAFILGCGILLFATPNATILYHLHTMLASRLSFRRITAVAVRPNATLYPVATRPFHPRTMVAVEPRGFAWIRRTLATETSTSKATERDTTGKIETGEGQSGATAESASENEEKPSLKDTVNRIKGDGHPDDSNPAFDDMLRKAADWWSDFRSEINKTWRELLQSGERKSINKKITPVATAEGDKPYDGPVDIMVIDPSEHLTAWERMQRRLTEAPIIQDVLKRTEEIYEKSGAKKVKQRVDEVAEDAREAWETSQNPWVYRVSSVYDTLTAETPESIAVKELRQLDPNFTLEDWRQDVVEHTLPMLMQWFLEGRINQLKDWFGEGVFKRVAAEITARKQEGVEIDTHVLGIMNSEILAVEVSRLDDRMTRWRVYSFTSATHKSTTVSHPLMFYFYAAR